jgi:hypothetical protein
MAASDDAIMRDHGLGAGDLARIKTAANKARALCDRFGKIYHADNLAWYTLGGSGFAVTRDNMEDLDEPYTKVEIVTCDPTTPYWIETIVARFEIPNAPQVTIDLLTHDKAWLNAVEAEHDPHLGGA